MGVGAVKAAQDNLQKSLPGRGASFQQSKAGRTHPLKDKLQRGGVEVFFALEVVVEQRLVDAGLLGNLLRTRASQTVCAELPYSSVEDASAGLVGALGLGAGWCVMYSFTN